MMNANAYTLLGVLQSHAPNGSAQQLCASMVHQAERSMVSDLGIEKMLANAIADGLNHGNWPWNQPSDVSSQVVINTKAHGS